MALLSALTSKVVGLFVMHVLLAMCRLFSNFPNVVEWLLNRCLAFLDSKLGLGLAAVCWLSSLLDRELLIPGPRDGKV
jgi:hypothetical protein